VSQLAFLFVPWVVSHGVSKHGEDAGAGAHIPSSSLTDSPMVTDVSWFEYWSTRILVSSIPSLRPCQRPCRKRNDPCPRDVTEECKENR
jgi:hypothetical protein